VRFSANPRAAEKKDTHIARATPTKRSPEHRAKTKIQLALDKERDKGENAAAAVRY